MRMTVRQIVRKGGRILYRKKLGARVLLYVILPHIMKSLHSNSAAIFEIAKAMPSGEKWQFSPYNGSGQTFICHVRQLTSI